MKDKWTAYCVAGLSALFVIGVIGVIVTKPRNQIGITVKAELTTAAVTETEPDESSAENTVSRIQTTLTESLSQECELPAETAPPERNLNQASAEDLKRVSGIGDALAEAILSAREACGGFASREQLSEISGIGDILMQRIMAEFEIPDEVFPTAPEPEPQPEPLPEPDPEPEDPVYYINVYDANTVTREELLTIPDMTEEKADAVLQMRDNLKGYHGIYEISLAEGISGEYFEYVLKEHLYIVGDPHSTAAPQETDDPAP